MNKTIIMAVCALACASANAQETYQSTKLVENELNGTARYVGMGGAMEALGADISTISSNPAGIGLFRKSQATVSGGMVAQSEADTHVGPVSFNGDKTNASFDQIGVVWARRYSSKSYLNLAFNYHKSRNFDQILTAMNSLTGASQNKLTALKLGLGMTDGMWNAVDQNYGGSDSKLIYQQTGTDGKTYDAMHFVNATGYYFGQYQKGYIGEYDFNISGNLNDRVFLGLTIGIHDVNYRSNSIYSEDLQGPQGADVMPSYMQGWEALKIDGTGYDIKAGVIFRPVAESPFRVGLYVNSPVFYDLTMKAAADLNMQAVITPETGGASQNVVMDNGQTGSLDFKVYTPWKFGVSLGHTIDNYLALGLTYEYSDYGTIDNRTNDGGYYDYYGDWVSDSSSDHVMNSNTKSSLRGVHLLKVGMEAKPAKEIAVRAGYNYQSAIFSKDAFRDGSLPSQGSAYATSTDFTNWSDTHHFTIGLGYQHKSLSVDLAYQYSQTDGTFYPFMSYRGDVAGQDWDNVATPSKVNFKRNQLLLTLGYRF